MKLFRHRIELYALMFCETADREYVINAAISTKDITSRLARVKSSNVWAYGINIRNNGDQTGDVYAQFKSKNGGPGDVYVYFDVPIRVYRKWVTAPSKGHFFWVYIRNNYRYAKLTGDKRTKLRNGVNS